MPDYIRCIWLSISLQRLLEKGSRRSAEQRRSPAEAPEALQEVLVLGDWAEANARQMVEASHAAISSRQNVAVRSSYDQSRHL